MRTVLVLVVAISLGACASVGQLQRDVRAHAVVQAGYVPTGTDLAEGRYLLFKDFVTRLFGVQVIEAIPPNDREAGAADLSQRLILINATMPFDAKFETLAHEAAHLLQPPNLTSAEAQAWADTVAHYVCREWGLKNEAATVAYLALFKSAVFAIQTQYEVDLNWAVSVLSGRAVRVF